MDLLPWSWPRQRRLWAVGGLMAVAAAVVAYRAHQGSGKDDEQQSYLGRLRAALRRYSEAFLLGSDISAALLHDLQAFLASDGQELPRSLRQLLRLAQPQEVQQSTQQLVSAAVRGAVEGASSGSGGGSSGVALEQLLAALSSERGSSLLTLAIRVACRSSAEVLCDHMARTEEAAAAAGQPDTLQRLLEFAGTPAGQGLATASIRTFVREGMDVYMTALEGTNGWADMLAAIGANSRNAAVMDRMTRISVREMVNAYFRRPTTPSPAPSPARSVRERSLALSTPISHGSPLRSPSVPDMRGCNGSSAAPPPAACIEQAASPAVLFSTARSHHASWPVAVDATAELLASPQAKPGARGAKLEQGAKPGLERGKGKREEEQGDASGGGGGWANDVIQVVRVPEARALLLALAATATAEGVRASLGAARELLLGRAQPQEGSAKVQLHNGEVAEAADGSIAAAATAVDGEALSVWLRMPLRQLYVLVCLAIVVVLWLTSRSRAERLGFLSFA